MTSKFATVGVCLFCLTAGYVAGSLQSQQASKAAFAQEKADLSEDAKDKIIKSYEAIKLAAEVLRQDGRYETATKSLNLVGVLAGGIHPKEDLEEGRGVDPETFAGLYAGDAAPGVAEHLSIDGDGKLLYKGKLVRIYSVAKLKKLHQSRQFNTGEERRVENN